MKCKHNSRTLLTVDRPGRGGFTMVEVLAAMLFMAIVIPVAIQGIMVANRAGVLATRKSAAARIAERLLGEGLLAGQFTQSTQGPVGNGAVQSGVERSGDIEYRWTIRNQPWDQNKLNDNGLTPTVPVHISGVQSGAISGSSTQAGATSVAITDQNVLRELSVEVSFPVQNASYSVLLSTLFVDYTQ
jgi:type II secretory pathway pseudopilin PulG